MGSRRKGREFALQILYQMDMSRVSALQAIRGFWELNAMPADEETKEFCEELVKGTAEHMNEIDGRIEATAANWKLSRMASVDRNILRMAVFELLHRDDIPSTVTINEAIELGKAFGSDESGAFINGILDKISETVPDLNKQQK